MKRLVSIAACVAVLSSVAAQGVGALPGEFTINDKGDKVYFSMGNLVYNEASGSFAFATNETDYGSYFGWGTSGYHDPLDEGNIYYLPTEQTIAYDATKTSNTTGYGPSFDEKDKLRDIRWNTYDGSRYANYDWGEYNPIVNGGNMAGMWRTLTEKEWTYILRNSDPQWVTRDEVVGLELTADDGVNKVFLPAAGYRGLDNKTATMGTPDMHEVGEQCNYWSASAVEEYSLSAMTMNYYHHTTGDKGELVSYNRFNAFSVRLVKNAAAAAWITVSDRVDNSAVLAEHKGEVPVNVHLVRTLYSDGWNTLCLPFALSTEEVEATFGANCQLYTFASARLNEDKTDLAIDLNPATEIEAGVAYVIQPQTDVVNPDLYNRIITLVGGEGEGTIGGDELQFAGIVNPHRLTPGDKRYLFVTAGDVLNWSKMSDTSSMYGLRAYFYVPDMIQTQVGVATRARLVIAPRTISTSLPRVEQNTHARKVLHKGSVKIVMPHNVYSIGGNNL